MTKRKRFTERQVLETLLLQNTAIRCFRCCSPLTLDKQDDHYVGKAEREHIHEFELGGDDTPDNCAYSAKSCHSIVTNGTKATTAGSSKHRIAKVARIARGGKRKGPGPKSQPFQKPPIGYRSPLSKAARQRRLSK
jgi:hypothetical protein